MGRRGENIRKRKDGRWEARIITGYAPDGNAKYRSLYGRTYLEAKEKRNDCLSNSPGCQKHYAAVRQPARKITVGQQHYSFTVESKIFAPKSRRPRMKVLSRKEQAKLEQYFCQHPDPVGLGILTALYGGVRIGELCALKWGDIYFDNGTVRLDPSAGPDNHS